MRDQPYQMVRWQPVLNGYPGQTGYHYPSFSLRLSAPAFADRRLLKETLQESINNHSVFCGPLSSLRTCSIPEINMMLSSPRPGLTRTAGRPSAACSPSPYICGVAGRHHRNAAIQNDVASHKLENSLQTGFAASFSMCLLTHAAPALAAAGEGSSPFEGVTANSLYVTLALFLMSVPGE